MDACGTGKGETPPGSKPVTANTSSGRATRAERAPAAAATFAASARRSPGTSASTGRPSHTNTSVFTISAASQPTAAAAAAAVGVPSSNSSSRASTACPRRTAATRSTDSGQGFMPRA